MIRIGTLELECPAVMGVLNVTPDSFSDGGSFTDLDNALRQAEGMRAEGAAIIDVGGESTRPGAADVAEQEELDRVIPVVEAITSRLDAPVSVDTSNPGVMQAAVAAGASLVNDVRALQDEGALTAAVELQRPICLMHMQGQPRTMQEHPHYDNVVADVAGFLRDRVEHCVAAGLGADLLIVDPGFGFGKTPEHNIELLANLRQLQSVGRPILVGLSRKSTLGKITGRDVDERLPAGLAAAVLAVEQGASIVRTHDVAPTVDALKIAQSVMAARQ